MKNKPLLIILAMISISASAMETFDVSQRSDEDLITITTNGPFCTFTDTLWYGNSPVKKNEHLKGTASFSTIMKIGDLRSHLSGNEKSIIFDRLSICDSKVDETMEVRIENDESAEVRKLNFGLSGFSPKYNTVQKFFKLNLR